MSNRKTRKARRGVGAELHFTCPGTIQAGDQDGVPSFEMRAYQGGRLYLSNFPHPAVIDAAGVEVHGGADVLPILRDHDGKRPIGHGTPTVNADSLDVAGRISQTTSDAQQVVEASKNGYPWQASVGGLISKTPRFVKAGESVTVNGQQQRGPVYVLPGFVWTETSVVSVGADADRAQMSIAATRGEPMGEFEKWLEAKGFDAADLSQDQQDALKAAWTAETDPDRKAKADLEALKAEDAAADLRSQMAAASKEVFEVNRLTDRFKGRVKDSDLQELHAKALDGEISPVQYELELTRKARPQAVPQGGGPGVPDTSADAIVAALSQAVGLSEEQTARGLKAEIGGPATEKAMNDCIALRDYNVHKLIFATLAQHGQAVPAGTSLNDSILKTALACGNQIQAAAGFSTISLPGILSRVANKAMLAAYEDTMSVGLRFAATTSTTDFKTFDRYRLTEVGDFEEVGATGEIKSSSLTEEMHQNQVKQYGKMFAITRVMLINDDLDAMMQIPRLLGRMGGRTLEKAIINTLVTAPTGAANTNFFFSNSSAKAKPNYAAGANTSLDIDSLGTAYKLFLDQVDSEGNPIMVEPSLLLVSNLNAVNSGKLFNDASYRFTGTDIKETIDNQWRGRFTPLVSPYLGILGTEEEWYLLPAPSDTACVNVAFLRGQQTPTIQQSEVDFNQLGVQMRGVFDFGVALWDKRLAVKMKGAA